MSNSMQRKLPPAPLPKVCLTTVEASNRHCGVSAVVKGNIDGNRAKLCFEFSNKSRAITPSSE